MKKSLLVGVAVVMALLAPSRAGADPITLFEAAFNIDGTGYSSFAGFQPNDLNAATGSPFDVSAFDFATGLGTIQVTVGGAGVHSVFGFYDLDLTDNTNSSFDDQGAVLGVPGAGQGFEIDEPGFAGYLPPLGDIYGHVFGGVLENVNNLVSPDDVSMALSWDLLLNAGQEAVLTFSTSTTDPGGFRLHQFDASGAEVFLSSNLRVRDVPVNVPEPALSLLAGVAMAVGAARRRLAGPR